MQSADAILGNIPCSSVYYVTKNKLDVNNIILDTTIPKNKRVAVLDKDWSDCVLKNE